MRPTDGRSARRAPGARTGFDLVVIGTSLGGFDALKVVLGALPRDFRLPVVVVQHQSEGAVTDLARLLQRYTPLGFVEPDDKERLEPGRVYLGPPGYHLLVERGSLALSTEGPVLRARPSIDVLFESAADTYGPGVIGVALTAASHDGAIGLARIKRKGGVAIVQDPATAESPILPAAVLAATAVDFVLPLAQVGPCLADLADGVARVVPTRAQRAVPA